MKYLKISMSVLYCVSSFVGSLARGADKILLSVGRFDCAHLSTQQIADSIHTRSIETLSCDQCETRDYWHNHVDERDELHTTKELVISIPNCYE